MFLIFLALSMRRLDLFMAEKSEDKRLAHLRSRNKYKQRVAFDAVYAEFADKLLAYSFRFVRNKETAEDIVQDAFTRFYSWVVERKDIRSIGGLLYAMVKSNCIRYYRDNKHKNTADFDDVKEFYEDEDAVSGEVKNNDDAINVALEQLSTSDREVIILAYYCSYSHKEIAELLGTTANNIAVHLYRAKQRFGKILKSIMSEENSK